MSFIKVDRDESFGWGASTVLVGGVQLHERSMTTGKVHWDGAET